MRGSDLKYLLAYLTPMFGWLGLYFGGILSFGSIYLGFVIIPILEYFIPYDQESKTQNLKPGWKYFFDILLYLNIPILYYLLLNYYWVLDHRSYSLLEYVGWAFNMGLILGTVGINVAHELGHRKNHYEQLASKLLLLPTGYMHFFVEHNRGHHRNVATYEDPATARFGESFYRFWYRSVIEGYKHAWLLEKQRLLREGLNYASWQNQMVRFTLYQVLYLWAAYILIGWIGVLSCILIAIIGFTFLELINYIEHYGLIRKKLSSGKYEKVNAMHSWNSNHSLGRIFLYELTRHSDHHMVASRKYQELQHRPEGPQLPYGYPHTILISLFPRLWYRHIHPNLFRYRPELQKTSEPEIIGI